MYVASILVLAGCQTKSGKQEFVEKAIPVTTVKVTSQVEVANFRYSGTVEAFQTVPLTFETPGTVEKVFVEAGDEVKKGQLLASLDKSNPQSMYNITLAKYQQAKDAYDRLKTVYEKGSLPEIKWVEMETNLQQAQSSLEISKNNLDKCNMYAPANGVVGRRNIEPGMSSITLGSAPFELVDIKQVYVKISVPENEIGKITKGMKAHFLVSALNNKTYEGEVAVISPVADLISRTYEVKVKVVNAEMLLKPGMVCDVIITVSNDSDMVLVPYKSVTVDEQNQSFVYVVDAVNHRVKKQLVTTGQFYGSNLEILSGLTTGQTIVNEGKEKLSDQSLITL